MRRLIARWLRTLAERIEPRKPSIYDIYFGGEQ